MNVQLTPGPEQLRDLAVLRDLGEEGINSIIEKLVALDSAIKPSEISGQLNVVLPDSPEKVSCIMDVLMSLVTLCKQRNITPEELLTGLDNGIASSKSWSEDETTKWKGLRPVLVKLFSLPALSIVVKALDLSYDYANLLQTAKILTDIRPVFDSDATSIQGSVVSHTLRIYYTSLEGNRHSLSLALDESDVIDLSKACERAMKKAKVAKDFMQNHGVKGSYITGEEAE